MSAPFIFVSTHRLKPGQGPAYEKYLTEFVPYVEGREPDLLIFSFHLDEDGDHVSVVQVHRNPQSMLNHMQIVREHVGEAYREYLDETVSIHVLGEPSDEVVGMIEQLASAGAPISVSRPINGFDRLA